MFVIAEGKVQVSREGQVLGEMKPGVVMGELGIVTIGCIIVGHTDSFNKISIFI